MMFMSEKFTTQRKTLLKTMKTLSEKEQKLKFCKAELSATEQEYLDCMIPSMNMNGSFFGDGISFLKPFDDPHPAWV